MAAKSVLKSGMPFLLSWLLAQPVFAQQQCVDFFTGRLSAQSSLNKKETPFTLKKKAAWRPSKDFFFTIEEGRQLFAQIIPPSDPSKPTLLLIPGVNRSLMADEAPTQALAAEGYGIVAFNFSTQPLSVATLKPGVKPAFMKRELSLKDLAFEVETVFQQLTAQRFKNIVPISMSYSAAVSAYLTKFPVIIDTVPMTSFAEKEPELEKARQTLKAAEFFNPFFGKALTRSTLDNAYRKQWQTQVERLARMAELPKERWPEMVEGYTMMSRAAEDFTWSGASEAATARHVFVVGENEQGTLKKHQLKTFQEKLKTEPDALMYYVKDAAHLFALEKPEAFAQVMHAAVGQESQKISGIVVFNPADSSSVHIPKEKADEYIQKLLSEP